eukprot:gnl/TRDRNA2_/TRDRNA2_179856_c0_seq1.p1 gnl/TRDRNA2_/TRDRNA2_179856_c0~~gnl/TRDRNA2_/TRDRNA2_179856_c0_seq1.p1  ORF type:complete len:114 (+),score=14.99 gnl/TRDRNA2_/TRDRNA2_179856_c0_seq1:102-443(+)
MVLTTLGRNAARNGALGRIVSRATAIPAVTQKTAPMMPMQIRCGGGYDWNLGVPGSRIKNPDPANYNDVYPGMGKGWWALITCAIVSFYTGQWYDTSRGVPIAIGLFGPNMPM